MNIRNTLLSLLTLTTTVTAPALAGYEYDGVHLMDGSDFGSHEVVATDMINSLTELGVPVIDGSKNNVKQCIPQDNKTILGFYSPVHNVMVICTKSVPVWLQMETLTHEAVHVIQDLRTGLDTHTLGEASDEILYKLVTNMADDKVSTIANLYNKKDWNVEVEAFFFETRPQLVANELRTWAF